MGGNLTLQQQQAQQAHNHMQMQRAQFFRGLQQQNGGQLPPNAEALWQELRVNKARALQQSRMQQAQGSPAAQSMQNMGGQNAGMQGSPNQMRMTPQQQAQRQQLQLQQQQAQLRHLHQQQAMRHAGAAGQQNMMNGMSPGQGSG